MRILLLDNPITQQASERDLEEPNSPNESFPLLQKPDLNKTQTPQIKKYLLDHRLQTALLLTVVQALIIGTHDATLTTEAANLFAFTSLESGILFLCLGLPNLIVAPLAGSAVDRFGSRKVATFGFALLAPSLALLRLPTHQLFGREVNLILFYAILTLNGICLSIASAPGVVAATHVVKELAAKDSGSLVSKGPYGQLFGLNWLVYNLGLTVGSAVGGELRNVIGYGNMYALVAGICGITAVAAHTWL